MPCQYFFDYVIINITSVMRGFKTCRIQSVKELKIEEKN